MPKPQSPEIVMTIEETLDKFETHRNGIAQTEAEERIKKYGKNSLDEPKKKNLILEYLSQFNNNILKILMVAAIISWFLGNQKDTIGIMFAVILSATIGFIQEYRSDRAVEYLKNMTKQKVRVKRDGSEKLIDSLDIVPGDIVIIEEGMKIPADMRLLVSIDIQVNESTLTGESLPIEKDNEVEKDNLLYTGTTVVSGRGEGIVIKTGMNTVFGKIAKLVSDENKEITPLQKSLDELGKTSGNLSIATAILFFIIGYFFLSKDLIKILTTAVILAVAGVPEGLPTIIAITLAIGMQTMAQKNAIVRRMSVIEDLGLITTICTDKTGTLTTNQMSPKYIYADGNAIDITRVEKRNDSIDQMFISAIIASRSASKSGKLRCE
jgi:Ca2+-transporting ATPase